MTAQAQENHDSSKDEARMPVVIRIPASLLKKIDECAKRKTLTRSAYIVSSMADLVNGDR